MFISFFLFFLRIASHASFKWLHCFSVFYLQPLSVCSFAFVKTEIMRQQRVSSCCIALFHNKKTWAAPWQLTTHSQLSNATKPPKRTLFNVTRWHCVMQAKQSDMICSDSLLKWKHCTCDNHCSTENWGRICHELALKRSLGSKVQSPTAARLESYCFVHILLYPALDAHKFTPIGS